MIFFLVNYGLAFKSLGSFLTIDIRCNFPFSINILSVQNSMAVTTKQDAFVYLVKLFGGEDSSDYIAIFWVLIIWVYMVELQHPIECAIPLHHFYY